MAMAMRGNPNSRDAERERQPTGPREVHLSFLRLQFGSVSSLGTPRPQTVQYTTLSSFADVSILHSYAISFKSII